MEHQVAPRLVEVLGPELIFAGLRSGRKDDVLKELSTLLSEQIEGVSPDLAARALLNRERQGSTALDGGIALPHAKLDTLTRLVACFGRSRKGINFGSADGRPTHFFFVVLSPANAGGSHLKLLAHFIQIFKSPSFRKQVMSAKSSDDIYRLIAEEDTK